MLLTLPALVVPVETEHVGEVLAELPGARQTPLSDACRSRRVRALANDSVVAGIDDIVLAVVQALGPVLGQHRWVGGRCRRDDRLIVRDARQMSVLCRVETAEAWLLRLVNADTPGTAIG